MAKLLDVSDSEGQEILIAVKSSEDQIHAVGLADLPVVKVNATLDDALRRARGVSKSFVAAMKDLPIDEAELEFGLAFTAKGNIYIAEAEAEASLKITIKLKNLKP